VPARRGQRIESHLSPAERRTLACNFTVDAVTAWLYAVFAGLTGPFLAILAVRRGAPPWAVGWLAAAPYVGLLFASWYGRWTERRRKVPIVVWTNALARPLLAVAGWTSGVGWYLAAVTGWNLLSAVGGPAYTAVEQAIYHRRWRGRLMGGVRFMLGLGQFVATLAAGRALHRWGSGPVFTVAAAFGVVAPFAGCAFG